MIVEPEDIELLEFFESEPFESSAEEGYFLYRYTDSNGITLDFSYNEVESSVQVNLLFNDNVISNYSQEGAVELSLRKDASGQYVSCSFDFEGATAEARVQLKPNLSVKWFTLLN